MFSHISIYIRSAEFYNKLLQRFLMRKFFLILLFLIPLSLVSEDDLDALLDQQHYKLFDYINKNEDLIDSDNKLGGIRNSKIKKNLRIKKSCNSLL